jgi:tetraacyldisaccharide 4'-kinase
MHAWFNRWFNQQWQSIGLAHIVLIPLSWLFGAVSAARRWLYQHQYLRSYRLSVPVVVVGNISVGGTGKTPLVIYLVEQLKQLGYTPGVISRGYGGNNVGEVTANSNASQFGDEPVLIAKRSTCPVWVNPNRIAAGRALLQAHPECNVIISDDGLQHYRLQRSVEIAMVDSEYSFGNECLLPAGPLREKMARLQTVDVIVDSGQAFNFKDDLPPVFSMQLQGNIFEPVDGSQVQQPASYFGNKNLVALAGIGNPARFFQHLSNLGLQFERAIFADHHAFAMQDLAPYMNRTILMTEKDAVKCKMFGLLDAWYLPVKAQISGEINNKLIEIIQKKLKTPD